MSAQQPLREVLRYLRDTQINDRMWPEEIAQAQRYITEQRSDVLPHLSKIKRAGVELGLRRLQRKLDASKSFLVDKISEQDDPKPPSVPHARDPVYASNVWITCKQWVLEHQGQAGLVKLADCIVGPVIEEATAYERGMNALVDVLESANIAPHRNTKQNNFEPLVWVWLKKVQEAEFDTPNASRILDVLIEHGADLEVLNDKGYTPLAHVLRVHMYQVFPNQKVKKFPAYSQYDLEIMNMLLDRGAKWKHLNDLIPSSLSKYAPFEMIKENAYVRRALLQEVVKDTVADTRQTPITPRPAI